jgi:hypothetical protein
LVTPDNLVPTPQKARRVRKSSVAEVLKKNRIRRFDADQVLAILRQMPVTVQDGAVAAATAHIETNECVALGPALASLGRNDGL